MPRLTQNMDLTCHTTLSSLYLPSLLGRCCFFTYLILSGCHRVKSWLTFVNKVKRKKPKQVIGNAVKLKNKWMWTNFKSKFSCSSSVGRAGQQVIGRVASSNPSSGLSWAVCRSVLEQDSEPQIAPDVWLAPCMAAFAISEGPAMSWRLVQGVPCPRSETAGIGSSEKPCDSMKKDKAVTDNGWMGQSVATVMSLQAVLYENTTWGSQTLYRTNLLYIGHKKPAQNNCPSDT